LRRYATNKVYSQSTQTDNNNNDNNNNNEVIMAAPKTLLHTINKLAAIPTLIDPTSSYDPTKHDPTKHISHVKLSQPFIGFIRQHEKVRCDT